MESQSTKPVPLTEAERLDAIKLSATSFAESDTLSGMAQSEIIRALSGVSFETWEAVRTAWVTAYQSARADVNAPIDEKSAGKAWQRLVKATGMEKPKSEKPEAAAKSATRERNEAGQKALAMLSDAALTESIEAMRPYAAQLMPRAIDRAATLMAEQNRRNKEREESESMATKKLRADCAEALKTATHEMLAVVRGILRGELVLPAEVLAEFAEPAATLETVQLKHAA